MLYSNRLMLNDGELVLFEAIVIVSSCKVCSRLSIERSTSSLSGTVVESVLSSSSTFNPTPVVNPVKVQDVPDRV